MIKKTHVNKNEYLRKPKSVFIASIAGPITLVIEKCNTWHDFHWKWRLATELEIWNLSYHYKTFEGHIILASLLNHQKIFRPNEAQSSTDASGSVFVNNIIFFANSEDIKILAQFPRNSILKFSTPNESLTYFSLSTIYLPWAPNENVTRLGLLSFWRTFFSSKISLV